ncbi:A-kinase anchor protein 2-like [Carcharodon carcharias]|uniref:A-kinase anchor protein 2-like n=1 Tax=Carcharodon carcharias TaxID=13397 RepID=UPI001B7E1C39|nr:A-kinase anchor protein 2-like [Carcharodon carcharias]
MLREVAMKKAERFAIIFKYSLEMGEVSEDWNVANVTPLFKKVYKEIPEFLDLPIGVSRFLTNNSTWNVYLWAVFCVLEICWKGVAPGDGSLVSEDSGTILEGWELQKPGILGIPVEVPAVNEVESQLSATTSRDPVYGSLLNSNTQLERIPEGKLVQNEDLEQDRVPCKDTRETPTGFSDWLEEQTDDEFGLKEGGEKESVFPKDPQTLILTEGSLGENPSVPMEGTEGNDFSTKNGPFVELDCSYSTLENGTHLLCLNSNPITLVDSGSSVSVTPTSEIDCSNDVIIHARKVSVIQHPDTDDQDTSVNDRRRGRISSETEHEEACARSTKLATIKREANFDLRTYHVEKKPTKLFSDDEGKYQTVIVKGTADDEMLAKERRAIIRNQAMKKNATIAERWGSVEQLDMEEKLSLDSMQKEDETCMSSIEANSSSFPKESFITHPEGINTEQINFTAARQQFLEMEKSQQVVPGSPRLSVEPLRISNNSPSLSESSKPLPCKGTGVLGTNPVVTLEAVRVDYIPDEEKGNTDEHSTKSNSIFAAENVATVENRDGETRQNLPVYSSIDDLDSGLGEMVNDYSYGYTSDGGASNEMLNIGTGNSGAFESSDQKLMLETPIEKEIRLAMEREESLRKERGIRKLGSSEEMVQIKTKPMLSQIPPTSPFSKSKDKNRMVFFVQREIEMDSKREEKLRQEGKVKGLYDKGTAEEVEKRKKVFEQQIDDVPVVPQQCWHPKAASFASPESLDMSNIPEESNTIQVNATECKVILQESPEYQLYSKSSSKLDPTTCSTVMRLAESQATREEEPYILRPLKCQTTFLIEREIEEEQRREEELRAWRLKQQPARNLSSTSASTPESPNSTLNLAFPGQPSRAGASDGDQAKSFPEMIPSQERRKPWEKKEDSSYAGIEASDDINMEVLESTRVTRRKSAMAQRWEAGMFNNHLDE